MADLNQFTTVYLNLRRHMLLASDAIELLPGPVQLGNAPAEDLVIPLINQLNEKETP